MMGTRFFRTAVIAAATLAAAIACSPAEQGVTQAQTGDAVVVLSEEACEQTCPVYDMTLHPDGAYARDVADQFDRVRSLADGESQFLFGIIELYQTKVHTKMTVAMERLAVIAAVTLPVTALASIYGMNVIVNDSTHWAQLAVILVVMLTISSALLVWARRQGWW